MTNIATNEPTAEEFAAMYDVFANEDETDRHVSKGESLNSILDICRQPPEIEDMDKIQDKSYMFMISPFKYDAERSRDEPTPIHNGYIDQWDHNSVCMPCSPSYIGKDKRRIWPSICQTLSGLKQKCDNKIATFEDLRQTIHQCTGHRYEINCLEILINKIYSNDERSHFMSTILSNICLLAMNVDKICSRPPPLLRTGMNQSVTMSQKQAASLLACAFFCLFPFRSEKDKIREYEKFQNPNFNRLYQSGPPEKVQKLRCILHYFRRITEKMPKGVITFQRYVLPNHSLPKWPNSKNKLCPIRLTTNTKIEDTNCVLQVDFANKYIGGGVLGNGCVQEEIRFSICPEMLVSLLVCEMIEINECVFLIGCERYCSYKGYANTFRFDGDYPDCTAKDRWGRKWCHLVAMDALFFRDKTSQYEMKCIERELLKAFTSFRPLEQRSDYKFGIATGNWGCGVFNGDKQLKAIIQLMAASESERPLIYAAYFDKSFVNIFFHVYEYLLNQKARVKDLYQYLYQYSHQHIQSSLFDYILTTPISSLNN